MALKNFIVRFVRPGISTGEPHNVQAREAINAAMTVLMDFKHLTLAKLIKEQGEVLGVLNGTGQPVYFDVETIFTEVRDSPMKLRSDES